MTYTHLGHLAWWTGVGLPVPSPPDTLLSFTASQLCRVFTVNPMLCAAQALAQTSASEVRIFKERLPKEILSKMKKIAVSLGNKLRKKGIKEKISIKPRLE